MSLRTLLLAFNFKPIWLQTLLWDLPLKPAVDFYVTHSVLSSQGAPTRGFAEPVIPKVPLMFTCITRMQHKDSGAVHSVGSASLEKPF